MQPVMAKLGHWSDQAFGQKGFAQHNGMGIPCPARGLLPHGKPGFARGCFLALKMVLVLRSAMVKNILLAWTCGCSSMTGCHMVGCKFGEVAGRSGPSSPEQPAAFGISASSWCGEMASRGWSDWLVCSAVSILQFPAKRVLPATFDGGGAMAGAGPAWHAWFGWSAVSSLSSFGSEGQKGPLE